jgi:hypothetical protein
MLTYQESSDLMKDPTFLGRVKVACLHFAVYISGEPADVPAHNTRYRWAQGTMQSPETVAANIAPTVVMEDQVQTEGSTISDQDLQTAVETSVNKLM